MANATYSELLTKYKNCLAAISFRQSYDIGGRRFSSADLGEVRRMVEWLEWQVAKEADADAGIGLASFGGPI